MKSVLTLLLASLATPALAHPGDHLGMTLAMLAEHLFETDHIVFALIAGAVGVLSYRAGRKAEIRAQEQHHDTK